MEKYLFLLPLLAIPTGIWALLFHLSLKSQRDRAAARGETPRLRGEIIGWCTFYFVGFVLFWTLATAMAEHIGHSKISAARSNAKMVYQTLRTWQEQHPGETLHAINDSTADPAAKGSPEALVQEYLVKSADFHYAVTLDDNGNPEAVYWSKRPITADEMHPFDLQEQLDRYMSPFVRDDEIVGSWTVYDNRMQH